MQYSRLNWLLVGFWLHVKHLHSDSDSDSEIVKYVKVIVPRLSSTKVLRNKLWHNDRASQRFKPSRKLRMLGNRDKTWASGDGVRGGTPAENGFSLHRSPLMTANSPPVSWKVKWGYGTPSPVGVLVPSYVTPIDACGTREYSALCIRVARQKTIIVGWWKIDGNSIQSTSVKERQIDKEYCY